MDIRQNEKKKEILLIKCARLLSLYHCLSVYASLNSHIAACTREVQATEKFKEPYFLLFIGPSKR